MSLCKPEVRLARHAKTMVLEVSIVSREEECVLSIRKFIFVYKIYRIPFVFFIGVL